MRKLAIPDIHGCLDKLIAVLEAANYNPEEDQLVLLGDYIDRGPDSMKVLEKVQELQKKGAIVLIGNHEMFMVEAIETGDQYKDRLWGANGGNRTIASYWKKYTSGKAVYRKLREHAKWLRTLPYYFEDDEYFYSHAPYNHCFAHIDLFKIDKWESIWSYGQPEDKHAKKPEGRIGVCGHVHALQQGIFEPRFYEHYYYLDAGCGCHPDAYLICADLTNKVYYTSNGDKVINGLQ